MTEVGLNPLPDLPQLPGMLRSGAAISPVQTIVMDASYALRLARAVETGLEVAAREAATAQVVADHEARLALAMLQLRQDTDRADAVLRRMWAWALLVGVVFGLVADLVARIAGGMM